MVNIFKKVNLLTKSNYSIPFYILTPVCFGMEKVKEVKSENAKANIFDEAIIAKAAEVIRTNRDNKVKLVKDIAEAAQDEVAKVLAKEIAKAIQDENDKAIRINEIAEAVKDKNIKTFSFLKSFFPDRYLKNKNKEVYELCWCQLNYIKSEYEKLKNLCKKGTEIVIEMKKKIKGLGYSDNESYIFLNDINKKPGDFLEKNIGVLYKCYLNLLCIGILKQINFSGKKGYDANGNKYFENYIYKMLSIAGRGSFSIAALADMIKKKQFIENGIVEKTETKIVGKTVFKISECNNVYNNECGIVSKNKNINVVNFMSSGSIDKIVENNQEYQLKTKIAHLGLEYCQHGDLLNFLYNYLKLKQINESLICYISGQILNGLIYLHLRGICHLDIKPNNILVDGFLNLKIADFSVSKLLSKQNDDIFLPQIGTPYCMAPEIINQEIINKIDLPKADVFSYGVMLYWLFTGKYLYSSGKSDNGYYYYDDFNIDIESLENRGATPVFIDFLTKCLAEDYNKRSSSFDLLKHPFIADFYCALRDHKEKLYKADCFVIDLKANCLEYLKTIKKYEFNEDGQLVCKEVKNADNNIIELEESEGNNIIKNDKKIFKIIKNIKKKYNNIITIDLKNYSVVDLNNVGEDIEDNKNNVININKSEDKKTIEGNIDKDGFKIPEIINKKGKKDKKGKELIGKKRKLSKKNKNDVGKDIEDNKNNVDNIKNNIIKIDRETFSLVGLNNVGENIKKKDKKDIKLISKKRKLSKKSKKDDDDK